MTNKNKVKPQTAYLLSLGKRHKDLNKEERSKYNRIVNKHRYHKLKSDPDKHERFNQLNKEFYDNRMKDSDYKEVCYAKRSAARKVKRANDHDGRYRFKMWFYNIQSRAGSYAEPEVLIGCTLEEARDHIMSLWTDGMSWDNYGKSRGRESWQIDHIEEVHAGGDHHYTNLQPLWQIDNIYKHWGKSSLHV